MRRETISRRKFLQLSTLSATAAVLVACQVAAPAAPQAAQEGAAPGSAEAVEVLMFDRDLPHEVAYRKELADRFMQENPTIKVTVDTIPQGYQETLMARIAAGTAGDAFRHATHWGMSKYAARGLLQPLDEFVELDNYDLTVFFTGLLESNRYQGKLYGLPVNGHPGESGIYYSPELFAEAGIDEPNDTWTYDDYNAAMVALTKDLDGDGKTDPWGAWVAPWYEAALTPIDAHDGWPLNEDGTKANWTNPGTMAGVQWIVDVYNDLKTAIPLGPWDARQALWSSGKLGTALSGVWEMSVLGDITPEGKTLKLSTGPLGPTGRRGGFAGCNNFPIWASSKHPYETFQWIKFLSSKEVGIEGVSRLGEPGLRFDVWEDPIIAEDPLIIPHYELLKVVKPFPAPANGRDSEVLEATTPLLEGMYLAELTVEQGCEQLQAKVEEILAMEIPTA